MPSFLQANSILFLSFAGLIGSLAGHIIYKLTFSLPRHLEKCWRLQAWQYLYPEDPIPPENAKQNTVDSSRHYRWLWLLSPLLSLLIAHQFGPHWTTAANLVLMWGLLLLASIDCKYQLLPDCLTLPLLWLGLCCNTFAMFTSTQQAIWGAMLGYLSLWLLATLFKYCRNKEGIGQGDFKLLAVLGAWWGPYPLFFIIMVGALTGACIGLVQISRGSHSVQKPMPFGPYLIFAALIVMFFNQQIKYILC